jgi:putative ABC transport system permease protein
MKTRWRKVLLDLWGNKVRTILVVQSLAIGVFALGMLIGTQTILGEELTASYRATDPSSAVLYIDYFDADFIQPIRRLNGVREAEGRRSINLRVQIGPQEWKNIRLDVIADYDNIQLSKIAPVAGAWPPPNRSLLIERASLSLLNAEVGDTIVLENYDGKQRRMAISGLVHDLHKETSLLTGVPYGYITLDTLEWLGYVREFDELHILVDGDNMDKEHIRNVADVVENQVEKSGRIVYWTWIPTPGEHPIAEVLESLLIVLGILAILSLFASCFLVINVINGLLGRQIKQIGIMKAIGGRTGQIIKMYLVAVVILGALALVIAVPLGIVAANALSGYFANLVNFDLTGSHISVEAVTIQVVIGIIVPLLTALHPVFKGAGITVREAIGDYDSGRGQFGSSMFERLVLWSTGSILLLSRPVLVSLRNTIRRKARLVLTLLTLTLGGVIFISIVSVNASLLLTLDEAFGYFNYDIGVDFTRPYRLEIIQREALKVSGVAGAEGWLDKTAHRLLPEDRKGSTFRLLGVMAETNLVKPYVLEGRWLLPDDEDAIVLNVIVLKYEPDIQVGSTIRLKIEGRENDWQVIGLVKGSMSGPIGYVNRPFLARRLHQMGLVSGIQIIDDKPAQDLAYQTELARQLKEHFKSAGLKVNSFEKTAEMRQNVEFQFGILVTFLSMMAIMLAGVGGLGLMGTLSMNVLERTREIGVMRAIGASDRSVLRIVLVEAVSVGIVSWFFAGIAAYPISKLMSDLVGNEFVETPLTYTFSINGVIAWLVIVLAISLLAGFLPAWNASRLSVRETLSYE